MTSLFIKRHNTTKDRIGIIILLLIVLFCFVAPQQAQAQTTIPQVIITNVDKTDFPRVKLEFEIRNAAPNQMAEPIKAEDIRILEGQSELKINKLSSAYMGTHFMLAVNTARNLALVDGNRISNYEKLIGAIKTLGSQLTPDSGDHFSFFINPESEWRELGNYSEWLTAIDSYEDIYGMRRLEHSFNSLDIALNAYEASELNKETVLVYIMPYIFPRELPQLLERVERAANLGLALHIWMVQEFADSEVPYQAELHDQLEAGGGSLTLFNNNSEDLPDPKSYLEGMGYVYTLVYESALRTTETADIAVQIKTAALGTLKSDFKMLSVVVEQAQLAFQNLANDVAIQLDNDKKTMPKELPLEVSIEFIDNYPREIVSTSLFINGKKVKENKEPPYGGFVIDLAPYQESTILKLEVRLNDIWGLQGSTGEKTIEIKVTKPETFIEEVSKGANRWLILGAGLGVLVLAAIFIVPNLRKKQKPNTQDSVVAETPKTSSEPAEDKKPGKKESLLGKLLSKKPAVKKVPQEAESKQREAPTQTSPELSLPPARHFGSLLKLDQDSTPSAVRPFLLTKSSVYIGRDPKLVDLVLDDPAIDPLHAELQLFDDGRATLTDFKTIAGTYRNYKAITANATPLQHGDILHFGTIMYRFHSATRTSSPTNMADTRSDDLISD